MTRTFVFTALLILAACSDPASPCARDGPSTGVPAFDLVGSLRAAGAEVIELGARLDQTLFTVQTETLSVNAQEVLKWEYCTGGQFVEDLGLYGIGVNAQDPPVIRKAPSTHLFTFARVIAKYEGDDVALIQLLTSVMGPELLP